MKKTFLISIILFGITSCHNSTTPQDKPETPKALQENKSTEYNLLSKRSYEREDLVEGLYSELVSKSDELKRLEDSIKFLNAVKEDSLITFNHFNQKNESYYSSAGQHAGQIKDSILREKIKLLIAGSQTKYANQISVHNNLIEILNSKFSTLEDLHTVLKLVKTLPVIEKYQKDNIPDKNTINKIIKGADKTIQKLDTLANR